MNVCALFGGLVFEEEDTFNRLLKNFGDIHSNRGAFKVQKFHLEDNLLLRIEGIIWERKAKRIDFDTFKPVEIDGFGTKLIEFDIFKQIEIDLFKNMEWRSRHFLW